MCCYYPLTLRCIDAWTAYFIPDSLFLHISLILSIYCSFVCVHTGAGGYVHIVCGRLKTWQMDLKMNSSCRAIAFLDEDTLSSSGIGEKKK